MDCKQTQETLCDFSAQACDETTERAVQQHLAQCPPCEEEWRALEASLLFLSTATQELPSSDQSRAMWTVCEKKLAETPPIASANASVQNAPVLPASTRPENAPSFSQRVRQALGLQPRFGWVAVGGAFVVLCGALLASPTSVVAPVENAREYSQVVQSSVRDETPVQLASVNAQKPPRDAALFVEHHAAMGFDPFSDHVGPTLVSFSASSPSQR